MLRSTEIVCSVYVVSCDYELFPAIFVLIRLFSPTSMITSDASGLGFTLVIVAEYSPMQAVTLSISPILMKFSYLLANLSKLFEGDMKLFIALTMLLIIVATFSDCF